MCFPPPSIVECASDDIFDLFIDDSNRINIKNDLCVTNALFQFQIELLPLDYESINEGQRIVPIPELNDFDELNPLFLPMEIIFL